MPQLLTAAPDFNLPGTDGKNHSLSSFQTARVLVVIFMCNHCPYVKAVLQRLIDLQNSMKERGVQLVGINSNDALRYPDDSPENMKKIVADKGINFPYLFDETQEVAKKFDAVCTPDIYVYGEERILLYRGRIDDNWEHSEKITARDLKEAIEDILSGRKISGKQIPSMGCSIKWKQ